MNDDYLVSELAKNNLSIIGKTLSDLFDINPNKIKSIMAKEEFQDFLLNKLSIETNAGQVGQIIADLNKIEPYAAKLFLSNPTFNKKIAALVENANLQQLGQFIHSIYRMQGFKELCKQIFFSIPSNIIASKVLDTSFKITNYDQPFKRLSYVDLDKAIEILELIDNDLIIHQAIGFKPNSVPPDYARKVSFTFNSLNKFIPNKINEIICKVLKSDSFNKKIDSLSKTDLLHCYANFAEISPESANNKFKKLVENLTPEDIKNESISSFSDGLRLLIEPLQLTKNSIIIKSFEPHLLSSYKNFSLAQISNTFMNLFEIDKTYSSELITNLDLKFMAKKIQETKNADSLNSSLGEIKKVNSLFHEKLITEIGDQDI